MGCGSLLHEVWRQNTKICTFACVFVVLEILLLVPDYGNPIPIVLAGGFAIILAAVILNRYFWVRMFRPLLQLAGAGKIHRGSGGECCCCCFCRKNENSKVNHLRILFVIVYIVIYGITISALATEQTVSTTNGKDPHPWVYFSFQWAGGFVLMLVSAWLVDLFIMSVRVIMYFVRRYKRRQAEDVDSFDKTTPRFKFPVLGFHVLWALAFIVLVSVASAMGTRDPVVKTIQVPLANLPDCLDGYSLAMISDIHAGPTVGRDEIERHVKNINNLGADAIVMVGDLVDDQVEDIGSIVDPVKGFSAPDGQYFVQGNHEYYTGEAEKWAAFVAERGFTVLNDTRVTLPLGTTEDEANGCFFYLAGVDDWEENPQYDKALDGRDASIATVLLAHQPKQVLEAADRSVGLQLSGHTHGGQMFPYHVLAWLDQGYVSGLHKKKDTYMYVSEGAVGWGPRMRLLSTTEYTLVVLRRPQAFGDPDTSTTESTRATGAAGVLFIISFVYCLCYPMWKAFRRAGNGDTSSSSGGLRRSSRIGDAEREERDHEESMRRRSAGDYAT